MHRWLLPCLAALLGASVAGAGPALQVDTIAAPLQHPWSLAFLPDGRMLVTERAGRLRIVDAGGLREAPVAGLPPVWVDNQAGLFDVLVDPDDADPPRLYLSFVHGNAEANSTRVVRARLHGDRLVELETLFTATPMRSNAHCGGRLLMLPDRSLVLGLGDGFVFRERAQHLGDTLGTIVRLAADGGIPDDNPFVGRDGARAEILSFGHRNVQGQVLHEGRLLAIEHGPRGGDELNLILPGANYGWPVVSHGIDYSFAMLTPYRQRDGMQAPMLTWTPSIAPAALHVVRGELFPGWQGDLLVAALAERSLRRVPMRDGQPQGDAQEILLRDLDRRIRHVTEGPDGALYLLTDHADGALLRITPAAAGTPR